MVGIPLVYLACIPGGIIGDKFLNNREAVSLAVLCCVLVIYHLYTKSIVFVGLILIITGVGLLKPNISTLVGQLYKENDNRRDQGFTIFYIGINFGAFFSSLIVGYVGEVYGWHYGFSLAGFGMLIGQYFFLKGKENFNEIKIKNKSSMLSFSFSSIEKDRIKLILISSFILIIFWASFEQAGGLMNIYAFEKTDRYLEIINFEVPASWFQSINPLMIIIFGFYVSAFWIFLRKRILLVPLYLKYQLELLLWD